MPKVAMLFVTTTGIPIGDALVEIRLTRTDFDDKTSGILMTRMESFRTNPDGFLLVELAATKALYHVTAYDTVQDIAIHYDFYVPESDDPDVIYRLEDIYVPPDTYMFSMPFDEAAMLKIIQARDAAKASAVAASQSQAAAQGAEQVATSKAAEALNSAQRAENALATAIGQVDGNYDAKNKKITNLANAETAADAVNLGLLDSRTTTLNQAITTAQTQADKGVSDAAAASQKVNDYSYPKAGNAAVTGYFGATIIDHIGTGAGQPRVRLTNTGYGEPTLALSRWSGSGENDITWRFTNNNGQLQIEFDSVNRLGAQINFASAMRLTLQEVSVIPNLRVEGHVTVGDADPTNAIRKTALLGWDGVSPVANENREVMRLRVLGIPNFTHNGAFRVYTSSGNNSPYSPGHVLSIFGWDASQGQAAKPALQLTGTGNLGVKSIVAAQFPLSSLNTVNGSGWMKIAKINPVLQGGDVVIRVSGTASYDAKPTSSSGSLTTIIARVDNDGQLRGSFHTEVPHAYGAPPEVIFGLDGAVYMLAANYYQLSVYIDCHSSLYEEQPVVYHSATLEPPQGSYAIKQWGLRLGNEGQSLHVTPTDITSTCNIRAQYVIPNADNAYDVGLPAQAYRTIYARTGTINTSDARLKRDFRELTDMEIAAACHIAQVIKAYRWKESVETKEEDAREHIGPTVQAAMAIMDSYGLDPFNYGFICYDKWDAEVIQHPAQKPVPEVLPVDAVEAVLDEEGNIIVEYQPAVQGRPGFPGVEAHTEVIREAGDRYAFRYDELSMFIFAGMSAKQKSLEDRLLALESASKVG